MRHQQLPMIAEGDHAYQDLCGIHTVVEEGPELDTDSAV